MIPTTRLRICSVAVFVTGSLFISPPLYAATPAGCHHPYFPLIAGNRSTYTYQSEQGAVSMQESIGQPTKEGVPMILTMNFEEGLMDARPPLESIMGVSLITCKKDGTLLTQQPVSGLINESSFVSVMLDVRFLSKPGVLLPGKLAKGSRWQNRMEIERERALTRKKGRVISENSYEVTGEERVTLPEGPVDALIVDVKNTVTRRPVETGEAARTVTTERYWLAKNIGVVKYLVKKSVSFDGRGKATDTYEPMSAYVLTKQETIRVKGVPGAPLALADRVLLKSSPGSASPQETAWKDGRGFNWYVNPQKDIPAEPGGSFRLHLVVTDRPQGYEGPVKMSLLSPPFGYSAKQLVIPKGKSDGYLTVNVSQYVFLMRGFPRLLNIRVDAGNVHQYGQVELRAPGETIPATPPAIQTPATNASGNTIAPSESPVSSVPTPAPSTVVTPASIPDAPSDLIVTSTSRDSVTIEWTVPRIEAGDVYEIRLWRDRTAPMAVSDWPYAYLSWGEPRRRDPGMRQYFRVENLSPNSTYALGVRACRAGVCTDPISVNATTRY